MKAQQSENGVWSEDLTRERWNYDGNYTVRWEKLFERRHFHGRTEAFFKSESTLNKPFQLCTKPRILAADNTIGVAPWDNVLEMRNSIDGTTVDELYVGLPKAHFRQVMCFEAYLPNVGGATALNLLYIGFEINSGGSFANIAALACHGDQWQLHAVDHKGAARTTNVTLRHPDAYARYALVYDPPILELWEAPVGSAAGHPLELTATLDLTTVCGKAIPFFANEDTHVSTFKVGDVWVFEMPDNPKCRLPTVYNVTITNANTEYSQALPSNCKAYEVHLRDAATFRLAYVTGKVAAPTAPYYTVPANGTHYKEGLNTGKLTLYLASPVATKVAEIIAWT